MKTYPQVAIIYAAANETEEIFSVLEEKHPLEVRAGGEFEKKAIFLPNCYEWVLGYDSFGQTILVALDHRTSPEIAGISLLAPVKVTTDIA